jgi:hypothetical protein
MKVIDWVEHGQTGRAVVGARRLEIRPRWPKQALFIEARTVDRSPITHFFWM